MKRDFSGLTQLAAPIRISTFLLLLLLLWLPIALPINWLVADTNLVNILTIACLYLEFVGLLVVWGRKVYRQAHPLAEVGWIWSWQSRQELLGGLLIGLGSVLSLFFVQGLLGAVQWQLPPAYLWRIGVEGLLIASAVGFAEELLFRGWLLTELQRDYSAQLALWISAIVYAVVHGFKPQFPALLLLGLTMGWAKRSTSDRLPGDRLRHQERLSLPIGLHAGLVWGYYIVHVGQVTQSTDRLPAWVTGIDDNPLASVTGLLFMGILAVRMRQLAQVRLPSSQSPDPDDDR